MRKPIILTTPFKRLLVSGSRIYHAQPRQTFHEFCIQIVHTEFGAEWYDKERKKPEEERHIVANWYISYCDLTRNPSPNAIKEKDGTWSDLPSGDTWSLITLGYDLFLVRDNAGILGGLPRGLIDRLKNRDGFQGARYELAIAATFARMDFKIDYMDKKSEKHWEFTAKHEKTGEVVAVEAKSRHRPGVLHQSGEQPSMDDVRVGTARMLNQALKQKPDGLPYVIFIDLNLPVSSDVPIKERKWWEDLKNAISLQKLSTPSNPDDFNMLFVTNFSYHYAGKGIIDSTAYPLDLSFIIPLYIKTPFKYPRTRDMIHQGVSSYGHVPNFC